jgi:hypothetical protein
MSGGFGHQMQEETNILPKIGRKCIVSKRQELALHPLYLLIHNVQGKWGYGDGPVIISDYVQQAN